MNYARIFLTTSLIAASMTTTALASRADKMLQRIDKNDDGKISLEEFHAREARWIERIDSDGDGAVSLEEITQHHSERAMARQAKMAAHRAKAQTALEEKFAAADTNQDGLVTGEEWRLEAFNRLDEDDDGYLSKKELKQARHGGKGFRQGGGFRKGHSHKAK